MWPGGDPAEAVGWSDASGASGGGFSELWAMPAYQAAAVSSYIAAHASTAGFAAPGSYNATNRAYPDVAAFMDGIPLCVDGRCEDISGGTSASTPTWGGLISLLNEARLAKVRTSFLFFALRFFC